MVIYLILFISFISVNCLILLFCICFDQTKRGFMTGDKFEELLKVMRGEESKLLNIKK